MRQSAGISRLTLPRMSRATANVCFTGWRATIPGSIFSGLLSKKADHALIGIINLGRVDEANALAETNYMLAPVCWGQGIMTEVLCAVLQYAFDEVGLNRVQAEVFDGNAASARVLEKCGMRFEGVARQRYYKHGHFIDTAQYAILRTDRDVH